jgi:hypothetical protein
MERTTAYTTILDVMVDIVKGGGRSSPTLARLDGHCHSVCTLWDMAKGLGEEKGGRGIRNYGKRVGREEEGEGGRELGKAELNLAFPRRPGSFFRFMFINFDFLSFLLGRFPLSFFQL